MIMEKEIVEVYQSTGSIKAVAKEFGISEQKTRKILFTQGVISTETSERVRELAAQGLDVSAIADKLKISKTCVSSYMPYVKGAYKSDTPTKNAVKIRRWREKRQK